MRILFVFIIFFIGCGEEHTSISKTTKNHENSTPEEALMGNDFQSLSNDDTHIHTSQKILDTTAKWKDNTVKWWYNPNKQKFTNTEEAIAIFQSAMESWSDVSGVKFSYQGTTNIDQFDVTDGKVVFGWADSDVVKKHFGNANIGAFVAFRHNGIFMVDARMTLNTSRYGSIRSYKGLITHELGHILGIGHSDVSESVMFANPYHTTVYQETLRADDIDAVRTLYPKEEHKVVAGIFDGAGSLVRPNEPCWGCDRDEAIMHPHDGVGSTVVFQFLKNSMECTHIDIRAKYDIGAVVVRSKGWEQNDLTERAYEYDSFPIGNSNKSEVGGISVEATSHSDSGDWTTLAVTTLNPISRITSIYAFCRNSSDIFNYGGRKKVDNDLVDVTYGYVWTGTGSLISRKTTQKAFGISVDWAVPFKTVNSLTSFQWDATNCKRVRITDGKTENYVDATVESKKWDEGHHTWKEECSSLPCTIYKSDNDYYVLKVKSGLNTFSQKYIQTICQ